MKLGNLISTGATPIAKLAGLDCYDSTMRDLRVGSPCYQMRDDFNNARHLRDYTNAILDRIRKRGKYKKET